MKLLFTFAVVVILQAVIVSPTSASSQLTAEELRLAKASQAMPDITRYFDWHQLTNNLVKVTDFHQAKQALSVLGEQLWQHSKTQVQTGALIDDRPLYWTRLTITAFIKSSLKTFSATEKSALIEAFETSSRGQQDLMFKKKTHKRILLTGFDPFLLDRNISQSNPSGLAALWFDGMVIEYQGRHGTISAEINTAMVPVRFEDFDQGEVEALLSPFYATNSVDLIATISMGRSHFDLEHFPGLRRSAAVPDNLNIYSGASKAKPIIPKLGGEDLSDKEFVVFSLPYHAMQQAKGQYEVNDNREVTSLDKTFSPKHLNDLHGHIAVEGGGGGYLSNEISYRSILLRNKLASKIPTGHIHTPRISNFDGKTNQAILWQIKAMLELSLSEI